jgi:hypothetical protein
MLHAMESGDFVVWQSTGKVLSGMKNNNAYNRHITQVMSPVVFILQFVLEIT